MPRVDLVYDTECPNVSAARANLRSAFAGFGLSPVWQEHRIGDPETPGELQGFGSPSILVDGRDVARVEPSREWCCRIYNEHGRTAGVPSIETITTALTGAFRPPRGPGVNAPITSGRSRPSRGRPSCVIEVRREVHL